MSNILDYVSSDLQKYIVKLDDFRMGKTIGAGPSGEVFYAYHAPTGTICAVKKLILKKLEGRHLKKFCRELAVLAKADHDNVLPFIGWTATFPYAIVTQYAQHGSLYDVLRRTNRKEKLTPTEKTKIAMGIAFGMEYLHKKGIMHRSLKSSNVLLDDKYRPMVSGFGLSRGQADESEFMTKQVGSPHWMAPECFIEEKYTNKVDVYSFGILLWEMFTEKTPFEGMSGMDIGLAVTQHAERPRFPDGTPKSFVDAVNEIWDQDPEKRLSFEQITRRFIHKKIIFPGTNINDINIFIEKLKANPPKCDRQKEPPLSKKAAKKAKKLNLVNPDDEANFTTLQRRHIKRAAAQALLDPTSYFEKLPEPTSPDFESQFKHLIGVVTVDTAPDFFKLVEPLFTQPIPDRVMALVASEINKLIKMDDKILHIFVELNFHTKLSFNTNVALITMKTLLYVTSKIPQAINSKLLEVISPHISLYPKPLIRIFANAILAFNKISNNWEVADYLITNSESFIYNAAVELVKTFYHLCKNYEQFKQYRLEYVWPIIQKVLTLAEPEPIHAAYCFICEFFDPKVLIPGDILAKHLEKANLIDDVISYLLRQKDQSIVTEKLLVNLITTLPIKQEAIYIIYNYIISNPNFGKIVVPLPWTDSTISLESRIGIMSLLLTQQEIIQDISNNNTIPQFLFDLLETSDPSMIEFACQIIFKIGKNDFYQALQACGFFQSYISKIPQLNSGLAIQTSLTMVDVISRSLFIEDFLSYIPYMVALISSQTDYTLPALSAVAAYTTHPRAKLTLSGINNIQQTLSSLTNEQYLPYVNVILNNMRS